MRNEPIPHIWRNHLVPCGIGGARPCPPARALSRARVWHVGDTGEGSATVVEGEQRQGAATQVDGGGAGRRRDGDMGQRGRDGFGGRAAAARGDGSGAGGRWRDGGGPARRRSSGGINITAGDLLVLSSKSARSPHGPAEMQKALGQ